MPSEDVVSDRRRSRAGFCRKLFLGAPSGPRRAPRRTGAGGLGKPDSVLPGRLKFNREAAVVSRSNSTFRAVRGLTAGVLGRPSRTVLRKVTPGFTSEPPSGSRADTGPRRLSVRRRAFPSHPGCSVLLSHPHVGGRPVPRRGRRAENGAGPSTTRTHVSGVSEPRGTCRLVSADAGPAAARSRPGSVRRASGPGHVVPRSGSEAVAGAAFRASGCVAPSSL